MSRPEKTALGQGGGDSADRTQRLVRSYLCPTEDMGKSKAERGIFNLEKIFLEEMLAARESMAHVLE